MMQDNTPINFYIKHFFINCQIKELQPIFDTFVPPYIYSGGQNKVGQVLLRNLAKIELSKPGLLHFAAKLTHTV
jgi:hypothetical protein